MSEELIKFLIYM